MGYFGLPGERLAGMADPSGAESLSRLAVDLAVQGVVAIVSLTEHGLRKTVQNELGLPVLHVPVPDLAPPTPYDVERVGDFVSSWRPGVVLLHCRSGIGRTGTMLACLLVTRGRTAEEAVSEVRRAKPSAINSRAQEEFIRGFARRSRA
ncbi:MAG: dual specificity protein phosphatase family protein [Myxococcales bacterium]|nr:dual specificity protein phosphatase family protein [Myxococcales bacterium]